MSDRKEEPDRRVRRTRRVIRDALVALIREKGFESITVQEIAARADVNRSTFYFHYRDKYDLLEQSNEEMLEAFKEALQVPAERANACTFAGMASATRHFVHIAEHADYYRVMLREVGLPCFSKHMKRAIEETFYQKFDAVQTDEREAQVPREILVAYVASAHFGLIEWWLDHDLRYSASYMVEVLNRLVKFGPLHAPSLDEALRA